ncbi:zinc finger and SCAN domain-containing protein 2 [Aplysia californica]|uniref:Zinc finger and SCAN domain-containing protein 2 n=1 Tax=Aplysia californica TaxID=6500 RepID=A0ABM0K8H6_APLCA|nr:zinc finger and SCAN domain-containing protein 2 [Aplysia californica]
MADGLKSEPVNRNVLTSASWRMEESAFTPGDKNKSDDKCTVKEQMCANSSCAPVGENLKPDFVKGGPSSGSACSNGSVEPDFGGLDYTNVSKKDYGSNSEFGFEEERDAYVDNKSSLGKEKHSSLLPHSGNKSVRRSNKSIEAVLKDKYVSLFPEDEDTIVQEGDQANSDKAKSETSFQDVTSLFGEKSSRPDTEVAGASNSKSTFRATLSLQSWEQTDGVSLPVKDTATEYSSEDDSFPFKSSLEGVLSGHLSPLASSYSAGRKRRHADDSSSGIFPQDTEIKQQKVDVDGGSGEPADVLPADDVLPASDIDQDSHHSGADDCRYKRCKGNSAKISAVKSNRLRNIIGKLKGMSSKRAAVASEVEEDKEQASGQEKLKSNDGSVKKSRKRSNSSKQCPGESAGLDNPPIIGGGSLAKGWNEVPTVSSVSSAESVNEDDRSQEVEEDSSREGKDEGIADGVPDGGEFVSSLINDTVDNAQNRELYGAYFLLYRSALLRHERSQAGEEKPHGCDVCGASFTMKSSLQRHKRTHTGEKPYTCEVCGLTFSLTGSLQRHKRTHTGEKPYKCEVCGVAFARSSSLQDHKRTHTGEKPYKCEICYVGFARSSHLQAHSRTHTGEKPYKCEVCGVGFARNSHLQTHYKTHTGQKRYKCEACGVGFARFSHLQTHNMTHNALHAGRNMRFEAEGGEDQ